MGRLLVDGYNVIWADPALRALDGGKPGPLARAELVRLLTKARVQGLLVVVVFDGTRPAGEQLDSPVVKVIYSAPEKADPVIAHMCTAQDVVVTRDRGLRDATLPGGARVKTADWLIGILRPSSRWQRRPSGPVEEEQKPSPPRFRRFAECSDCMWRDRDDGAMRCEADALAGRADFYQRHW